MRVLLILSCLALCSCQRPTSPAGAPGKEADPVAEIVAHKWWKKKPTVAEVEQLAEQIAALNANEALYIDEDGRTALFSNPNPGLSPSDVRPPSELSKRNFNVWLDQRAYKKRLTHEQALAALKSELDRADFKRR